VWEEEWGGWPCLDQMGKRTHDQTLRPSTPTIVVAELVWRGTGMVMVEGETWRLVWVWSVDVDVVVVVIGVTSDDNNGSISENAGRT
jgi:hypothetical protein